MVHDRSLADRDTLESPVPGVVGTSIERFSQFFRGQSAPVPEELLHAARALIWVRRLGLTAALWRFTTA